MAADIIDAANDLAQAEIDFLVATRELPKPLVGTGACLCCAQPLSNSQQRWCDAECRDIYLKHNPEPARRTIPRNAVASFGPGGMAAVSFDMGN